MTRPLEILIGADVSPDPNSGAAGTVLETSHALERMGHTVDSIWADDLGRRIRHGNLHYILELPLAYRRVVKARLRSRNFDVVQLSQPHSYMAGKWLMSRPSRPLMVWRSHGLEAKVDEVLARHAPMAGRGLRATLRALSRNRLERAQRLAMKWCDGAIVPCEDDKRFLVERFGADPERVRVIWHGVPDKYIDRPVSVDPGRWRRILHISQFSANKGRMVMHEVVAKVLTEQTDALMTWVCPEQYHKEIRTHLPTAVIERVTLVGWGSRDALIHLYDSHGLFLFPTLAEGAAKVVMEAMARGMCVVSSDTSGPSDYIESGKSGELVPVGDSVAMANAATRLLGNENRCRVLGDGARDVAAAFRWRRCAASMCEFYQHLETMRRNGHR